MNKKIHQGVIIEINELLTLTEFGQAINADEPFIIEMVNFHLIQPQGNSPKNWQFDSLCLQRAKKAVSFHRDLEINFSGIALALDLLEEIEKLENEINKLELLTK